MAIMSFGIETASNGATGFGTLSGTWDPATVDGSLKLKGLVTQ